MRVHHKWLYAYVDMLLAYNFVLTAAVFFLMLNVNPIAKDQEALPPPGSLAITVAWPEGNIDVDTWLKSPDDDKPVGYSRKDGDSCALLRDDLGVLNDSAPFNLENAFCRSLPAGEWIINIHGYSVPQALVKVHVEIALNGQLLVSRDLELKPRQERTVVRFKLDGSGQVVPGSENEVFAPLRSTQ